MSSSLISLIFKGRVLELVALLPTMGVFNIFVIIRECNRKLKTIGFEWSLLTLIGTIVLWASFDGEGQFQAIEILE